MGQEPAAVDEGRMLHDCHPCSLLLTAQALGHIDVGKPELFAGLGVLAIVLRLFTAVSSADPYVVLENIVSALVFGRADFSDVTEGAATGQIPVPKGPKAKKKVN